jgi:hypothetical protein
MVKKLKHLKTFEQNADKNLNISDVSVSKKFSKEDIINNFRVFINTKGFDFNTTMEEKLKIYIDWLETKID